MDFSIILQYLPSAGILISILCILFLFYRIQKSNKLDFADMLTKNGKSVSLTKVLQLVGGTTATWVIIHLTLSQTLTTEYLLVYLAYVGSVEAFSKFVAAKYNYNEKSIKDASAEEPSPKTENITN